MLDTRNIYPLSDFQRNAKDFISQLKKSQQPIVLTVNGKAALVIQDAEAYQELLDSLDVARSTTVIQQRHAQYLKDGVEFDAIEALENLRGELKELKEQRDS